MPDAKTRRLADGTALASTVDEAATGMVDAADTTVAAEGEFPEDQTGILDALDKLAEAQVGIDALSDKASREILLVEQRFNKLKRPLVHERNLAIVRVCCLGCRTTAGASGGILDAPIATPASTLPVISECHCAQEQPLCDHEHAVAPLSHPGGPCSQANVPHFWLTVLLNCPASRDYVTVEDEAALAFCSALDVVEADDIMSGFDIVMVRRPLCAKGAQRCTMRHRSLLH